MRFLAPLFAFLPTAPRACDLALVLAVDVSGSVDPKEYAIQMQGLAVALQDGVVAAALVEQQAQVALVQWSGSSRQEQSLPWTQMRDFGDVAAFAAAVDAAPRRWRNFSTALGEAVALSVGLFGQVPGCKRRVIDVSGDGASNEGVAPAQMRALLDQQGVIVNGLAIETDDADLTGYFYENLIWGRGGLCDHRQWICGLSRANQTQIAARDPKAGQHAGSEIAFCDHTKMTRDHKIRDTVPILGANSPAVPINRILTLCDYVTVAQNLLSLCVTKGQRSHPWLT